MEALYSITANWDDDDGGLRSSSNKTEEGGRYNQKQKKKGVSVTGVYLHDEEEKYKIFSYTRFSPVFADGTYCRAYIEVVCDPGYRVSY